MALYNTFIPQLIVETTNACNMRCKGCYAENILINKGNKNKIKNLSPKKLANNLNEIFEKNSSNNPIITFRGGEPSLAPNIDEMINIASEYSNKVYLESNGLWLLEKSSKYEKLIETLKKTESVLKLSFDNLHNSKKVLTKKIIQAAKAHNLTLSFGITASSKNEYINIIEKLALPNDSIFYYQPLVKTTKELRPPELGVIKQNGEIYDRL